MLTEVYPYLDILNLQETMVTKIFVENKSWRTLYFLNLVCNLQPEKITPFYFWEYSWHVNALKFKASLCIAFRKTELA